MPQAPALRRQDGRSPACAHRSLYGSCGSGAGGAADEERRRGGCHACSGGAAPRCGDAEPGQGAGVCLGEGQGWSGRLCAWLGCLAAGCMAAGHACLRKHMQVQAARAAARAVRAWHTPQWGQCRPHPVAMARWAHTDACPHTRTRRRTTLTDMPCVPLSTHTAVTETSMVL